MNSKEKINNIKSLINEFYHKEKCEGTLTECANNCWKSYQKDCDEIKQDLDRLEQLEEENQELRKRETPMKPVRKGKLNSLYCPKCDRPLMFEGTIYCDKCGQKLGSDNDD